MTVYMDPRIFDQILQNADLSREEAIKELEALVLMAKIGAAPQEYGDRARAELYKLRHVQS